MATVQAPEIQFAQRLASNEKPIRTKALKKLRKYIRAKSQRVEGGLSRDEMLKLWKGLFYCLWMQDKPLLQEELSSQIAGLLHVFQNVDSQFLYVETFLETVKREWTGIDRLRMDKFFQLVRFVFRQTFELLKRKEWDTSVVTTFLELLTSQILQRTSSAPCGLQFHILDLYLTELAGVGSKQLTAEQNLTFIEPFCKTAAKTKDRILLKAICGSIFSTIIDQAPFAITDLLKELKASGAGDSDSGQASEEEEENVEEVKKKKKKGEKRKSADKKASKMNSEKQMNGTTTAEDDEMLHEDSDDEMLHLEEDSDTELPDDEDVGPVLQFDYGGLANKLFQLASRNSTPSANRHSLYRIVKALRSLSEGVFPQADYPEEVSTDEDDDNFCSRKRMKRTRDPGEEEGPTAKKAKGKKKGAVKPTKSDKAKTVEDTAEASIKKKKKKKKKVAEEKKAGDSEEKSGASEEQTAHREGLVVKAVVVDSETPPIAALQTECEKKDLEKEDSALLDSAEVQNDIPASSEATHTVSPTDTERPEHDTENPENDTENPAPTTIVVGSLSCVTVTQTASEPEPPVVSEGNQKDQSQSKPDSEESEASVDITPPAREDHAPGTQVDEAAERVLEQEGVPEIATTPTTTIIPTTTTTTPDEKTEGKSVEAEVEATADSIATPLRKSTRKKRKQEEEVKPKREEEVPPTETPDTGAVVAAPGESPVDATTEDDQSKSEQNSEECEGSAGEPAAVRTLNEEAGEEAAEQESVPEMATTTTSPGTKKKRRTKSAKLQNAEETVEMEAESVNAEVTSAANSEETPTEDTTSTPARKKKKKKKLKLEEVTEVEITAVDISENNVADATPVKKKKKSNKAQLDMNAIGEEEQVAVMPSIKKKKKKQNIPGEEDDIDGEKQVEVEESVEGDKLPTPLKKKSKYPVVIEVEAEELEEAANSVAEKKAKKLSTPKSAKKSPKLTGLKAKAKNKGADDFITFQSNSTVPSPLFCKTKGHPNTPLSNKKKLLTPKSESKKVTFGLKNNKTAEFRKNDRSVLLTPEGPSRVAFDPKQKPLFGVLKSPTSSPVGSAKKTPKSASKGRPTAADFF